MRFRTVLKSHANSNFVEKFEFETVHERVDLVDLEKCCKISVQCLLAKIGFAIRS